MTNLNHTPYSSSYDYDFSYLMNDQEIIVSASKTILRTSA